MEENRTGHMTELREGDGERDRRRDSERDSRGDGERDSRRNSERDSRGNSERDSRRNSERERNMRERKRGSALESTFAKIAAFFVLVLGFIMGAAGAAGCLFLADNDAYRQGISKVIRDRMVQNVWEDVGNLRSYYPDGDLEQMGQYLENSNMQVELYREGELLWGNYKGMDTPYSFNCFITVEMPADENTESDEVSTLITIEEVSDSEKSQGTHKLMTAEDATVVDKTQEAGDSEAETEKTKLVELHYKIYIDDSFPVQDAYWQIYNEFIWLEDYLYLIPALAVVGILLAICAFLFLMCSAGHHRGSEGVTGGVLSKFPFDVVTLFFAAGAVCLPIPVIEFWSSSATVLDVIGVIVIGAAEAVWCTIYCMEFAVQLKMGTLFKNTLIYHIICWFFRMLRTIGRGIVTLVREIPTMLSVAVIYGCICMVDLLAMFLFFWWNRFWNFDVAMLVFWFLEKLVLFFIVFGVALMFKRLLDGSKALAEGDLNYKVDTSKLILGLKEQGENLNRIGEGISLAVEERMKSERLKTELITNVSHDLKTPLTSIINYADLLGTQNGNQEQVAEYAEVLLRQSKRLKKLLDDLLEASKATTGNLEVSMEPCEIRVLLSQAVGEYEQRFEEKQLDMIIHQPEDAVIIEADGRHLWRVFDNLLNNICKYAQENTRVYLTVEKDELGVRIIFRNMSKYPLELSAEELKERFVRGDKSRHMEGNGLGLSIAGSLMELQGGSMKIVTDGDLFKVILEFPVPEKD